MKLCIDAGHGGRDPGSAAEVPFRLEEKEFNLAVALFLEEELESRGHWVVMTRRRDRTLAPVARAAFANRLGAELFVSVHANAAPTSDVEGMEVFYFPGASIGRRVGRSVLAHMLAAFPGHRDRGVKPARFTVLGATSMPAILVECEFLTNPAQLRFLARRSNQVKLAQAIAAGLEGGNTHLAAFAR